MKKQSISCTSTKVAYKNDIKADLVMSYSPMLGRPCFADYATSNSYQLYLELV